MTRPLSDADYRALAQFRHALRVFLRFSEDEARAEGITPAQHQLLLAIRGWVGGRPPSTGEIAEVLQLRLHSAGELVHRAEVAGLVATSADPADARRRLLHLTEAGDRHLAALSASHRRELRRFREEMAEVLRELD